MSAGESISFDKVASIYDATRGGLERGNRFAASIAPFCVDAPLFEIGIGTGAIAQPLRDRLGTAVVGADLSPAMLTQAYERLGSTVAVGDVQALPVRTGSVGTVVASWILHLVGDPPAVLDEVHRILVPHGRLIVVSSRGEPEPDDIEAVMVDLHDVIRGRLDIAERLVPLAAAQGFTLEAEELSEAGTWEESPLDLVERMERRQWGALIDLDDARFAAIVEPLIGALRALPEPDRARTRVGRHRFFVFSPHRRS